MTQPLDRIFLQQVEFETIVGVFSWEQNNPRPILIDVTLSVDIQPAVKQDDLTKTIDYDKVYNTIVACGQSRTYQLIETLAEEIAQALLKTYPRILQLDLTVYKPGAVPQAKTVGITITRFPSIS
jgi:dihydroneopterin aldolase